MSQGSSHSMRMEVETESWAYKVPFRVSRGAESALDVVVVTFTDSDGHVGRGEAAGVDYDGETVTLLCAQIEAVRPAIEHGVASLVPGGQTSTCAKNIASPSRRPSAGSPRCRRNACGSPIEAY